MDIEIERHFYGCGLTMPVEKMPTESLRGVTDGHRPLISATLSSVEEILNLQQGNILSDQVRNVVLIN